MMMLYFWFWFCFFEPDVSFVFVAFLGAWGTGTGTGREGGGDAGGVLNALSMIAFATGSCSGAAAADDSSTGMGINDFFKGDGFFRLDFDLFSDSAVSFFESANSLKASSAATF
jgi:hypothetical protein